MAVEPSETPQSPLPTEVAETSGRGTVLAGLLRTMRPKQWVKNLFVLLPVVFAKVMLDTGKVALGLAAFVCFCAASSAVYVLNDLHDLEADRAHPKKRTRPIAAGVVPERVAWIAFAVLGLGAVLGGLAI